MDHHERELLESALKLLHQIIGYADAKEDFSTLQRKSFQILSFPDIKKSPCDGLRRRDGSRRYVG